MFVMLSAIETAHYLNFEIFFRHLPDLDDKTIDLFRQPPYSYSNIIFLICCDEFVRSP